MKQIDKLTERILFKINNFVKEDLELQKELKEIFNYQVSLDGKFTAINRHLLMCSNTSIQISLNDILIETALLTRIGLDKEDDCIQYIQCLNYLDRLNHINDLLTVAIYNINIFKSKYDMSTAIVPYPIGNKEPHLIREVDIIDFALSKGLIEKEEEDYIQSIEPRF